MPNKKSGELAGMIIFLILIDILVIMVSCSLSKWLPQTTSSAETIKSTEAAQEQVTEECTTIETDVVENIIITEPATEVTIYVPTIEDLGDIEAQWGEAAVYVAKTIWGEARGDSREGQEKVVWCILNRVDSPDFPNTIIEVILQPNQFHGYSASFPCTDEFYELALDVIARWQLEKIGGESNRILESDYLFFRSDPSGLGNIFRKEW